MLFVGNQCHPIHVLIYIFGAYPLLVLRKAVHRLKVHWKLQRLLALVLRVKFYCAWLTLGLKDTQGHHNQQKTDVNGATTPPPHTHTQPTLGPGFLCSMLKNSIAASVSSHSTRLAVQVCSVTVRNVWSRVDCDVFAAVFRLWTEFSHLQVFSKAPFTLFPPDDNRRRFRVWQAVKGEIPGKTPVGCALRSPLPRFAFCLWEIAAAQPSLTFELVVRGKQRHSGKMSQIIQARMWWSQVDCYSVIDDAGPQHLQLRNTCVTI